MYRQNPPVQYSLKRSHDMVRFANRMSMYIRLVIPALVATFSLLAMPAAAGGLSPDLTARISAAGSDQMVKVWIKLPPSPQDQQLRARAAQAATLAEQHRDIISSLKTDHAERQAGLKSALDSLTAVGKARGVKQHWITNVVEAELPVSELTLLAARADIETIYPAPEIRLIEPVDSGSTPSVSPNADTYTVNLRRIRADVAHAAGYKGTGRLICSFDTGVDGAHPALRTRWRGYNGSPADSAASWFDPVYHNPYPTRISQSLSPDHGTHVMGIMVGWDSVNSNMYGVAPNAKWISAAVIDVTGASILDGFEWAADPDGDPNTISDMPDVINHSWGYQKNWNYGVECQDLFWDAIDNTEALGIVNIFAAGNTGQYPPPTIFNPANRANDSLDCFAVGNLTSADTLNTTSSRGPSQCNGAIKPNVVAPGTSITSTYPNNTYVGLSGTSMSAPHVSGLVALLRQKNPNATVNQIKQAILTSTDDLGRTLPNNNYGWGLIDCMAAINALPANPTSVSLRLYDFVHAPITPGATITGTLRILNTGTGNALSVTGTINGSHPSLTIYDGIGYVGSIGPGAVGTSDQIQVRISDTVTVGSVIAVPLLITSTGGSPVQTMLHFLVTPASHESVATHSTGRIQFSLSNFGVMGMAAGSLVPLGYSGFRFDGSGNNFFEAGLMAANSSGAVVSGVHSYIYSYDNDFKVAPGGNMQFLSPGSITDQQTFSIFTDSSSFQPIGLRFVQESFSDVSPNDDFIIIRYILTNLSGATLSNLRVGLYLDWDVVQYNTNAGGFNLSDSVLWMANNTGSESSPILSNYRVARILDGPFSSGYTQSGAYVYLDERSTSGYDGFTPTEKYTFMTNGTSTATTQAGARKELVQVLAAGPIPLAAGQIDTVAFVLAAGADYTMASYAVFRAQELYDSVLHGPHSDVPDEPSGLPRTFVLCQNYPNPFNPGTTISFDLPRAADYRLEIFDLLGRRVDERSGHASAGRVELQWDGANAASGIYLYRVTAGAFTACRKMMLLK